MGGIPVENNRNTEPHPHVDHSEQSEMHSSKMYDNY